MGIRFHCPYGHRMNVKAFLAGRRGLCPTCGAKFDIPFQSEPEALAGDATEKTGAESTDESTDQSTEESTDTIVLDLPYLAAPPTAPTEPWSSPIEPTAAAHQVALGSVPPEATASAEAAGQAQDRPAPLPSTKWYLRLGTGEQFGPVRDEVIRQWFDDGRIVANTPIWRDGWADWRSASTVFRAAGGLVPTPPEIPAKQMSSGDLSEALSFARSLPVAKVEKRQPWTQKQWTTVISLMLLGVIVILGTIILVMLLSQVLQPEPQQPPPQPPAAKSPLGDSRPLTTVLA